MGTLAELAAGDTMRIERCDASRDVHRRLMELGLCAGAVVRVVRRAPLGGPLLVRVHGTEIALRPSAAAGIYGDVL